MSWIMYFKLQFTSTIYFHVCHHIQIQWDVTFRASQPVAEINKVICQISNWRENKKPRFLICLSKE
jgi:hypothetical protein